MKAINEHEPAELSSIAAQPANKALNRFQNIVPYDFNRVVLSTKPDYINASHVVIPIGDKSMQYILAPPPVPDSIGMSTLELVARQHSFFALSADFWQTIAEKRVKCIVGVFSDQDLKKMKCPSYWPAALKATMTLSPLYE